MEGIVKSVEQTEPTSPITHSNTQGIDALCYEQVPVDVYRFFDLDLASVDSKTIDKLSSISNWAFGESTTLGDGLLKLRSLEIQLGVPSGDDNRHDKMWRWVKMQQQIEDLQKRQGAI